MQHISVSPVKITFLGTAFENIMLANGVFRGNPQSNYIRTLRSKVEQMKEFIRFTLIFPNRFTTYDFAYLSLFFYIQACMPADRVKALRILKNSKLQSYKKFLHPIRSLLPSVSYI